MDSAIIKELITQLQETRMEMKKTKHIRKTPENPQEAELDPKQEKVGHQKTYKKI